MTEFLLINSPILQTQYDPESEMKIPPLGIGYIYTQLKLAGIDCVFIDAIVENLFPSQVIERIKLSDSNYIGLNIFSSNLLLVHQIIENSPKEKMFFLGGPAVLYLVDEIKSWNLDTKIIIISGESELVLPRIIKEPDKWINQTERVQHIIIDNTSPFFPKSIDLPIDRSIFYNEPIIRHDLGIVESHIIASRGCIYNCGFCTAATSLNKAISPRYRSKDSLLSELLYIKEKQPTTNCIRVLDDLFLRDQPSVELAIEVFSKFNFEWRSMAHVNTFKNIPCETIDKIKASGCRELFFGIESGDDEMLHAIHKPFSVETVKSTLEKIIRSKIKVKCYFILGFPGETIRQAEATIDLARQIVTYARSIGMEDHVRISPFRFRPYHGTFLYNKLVSEGKLIQDIENREDNLHSGFVDQFDCISGIYSEYNETKLNEFILEINKLND
jgi:Fe-S oxidoreductase